MIFGTPSIVSDNLLIYLDAGNGISYGGSGTTWKNIGVPRTAGINGTLTGTPRFNTNYGGSIVLNGSNQYISLGNNTTTAVTASFSIGFIGTMSNTNPSSLQTLYGKQDAGQYGVEILSTATPKVLNSYLYIAGAYLQIQEPMTNYTNDVPFYHVMTFNSTTGVLSTYRNGKLVVTGSKAGAIGTTTIGAVIGCNPGSTNTNFLSGSVSLYQHYSRTLSNQEVLQNYNAYKTRFGLS